MSFVRECLRGALARDFSDRARRVLSYPENVEPIRRCFEEFADDDTVIPLIDGCLSGEYSSGAIANNIYMSWAVSIKSYRSIFDDLLEQDELLGNNSKGEIIRIYESLRACLERRGHILEILDFSVRRNGLEATANPYVIRHALRQEFKTPEDYVESSLDFFDSWQAITRISWQQHQQAMPELPQYVTAHAQGLRRVYENIIFSADVEEVYSGLEMACSVR